MLCRRLTAAPRAGAPGSSNAAAMGPRLLVVGRARSLQRAANDPPPMQRRHRRRFGDAGTPPIEHPGYPASLCLQLRFISPAHRLCKMFGAFSRKSSSCPAGLTYISQARRCFQAKAPPPSTPSTCPVP
jgi:hypothetical protein